jgi:histidinol-phosphatase (PHP family)
MEEYVKSAISKGLQSMTFLEHLECGVSYILRTWLREEHFAEYFRTGKKLQQKYSDVIAIRLGVEVGYNPEAIPQLQQMLNRFPFEHIGLSCHFLRIEDKFINIFSRRPENIKANLAAGPEYILTRYFETLTAACETLTCDKICHLDAALRHLPNISLTSQHEEQIERLMGLMCKKKVALEVNTSGIYIRSIPFPTPSLIKKAISMGILLIPGSDAHRPEHVGRGFSVLSNFIL